MEHRLSLYQCYITDHHSQAGRENRSTSMANCSFLLVSQTSTIVQEGDRRVYCSHHTFFPIKWRDEDSAPQEPYRVPT